MAVKDREDAVESVDFRAEKMPSREGLKMAWDRYATAVERLTRAGMLPVVEPAAKRVAAEMVLSRGGFWLVWQLEGGFEGLRRLGLSEASIYRKVKAFRQTFGVHPDNFKMPGVTLDIEEYLGWQASQKRE